MVTWLYVKQGGGWGVKKKKAYRSETGERLNLRPSERWRVGVKESVYSRDISIQCEVKGMHRIELQ